MMLALLVLALGAEVPLEPTHHRPTGTYTRLQVELENGVQVAKSKPAPLPARLSFREGKLATLWLLHPERADLTVWTTTSTVAWRDGKLTGEWVGLATGDGFSNKTAVDVRLSFDARTEGESLTGTYSGQWGTETLKGRLTGRIETASEAVAGAWPSYFGSGFGFTSEGKQPLLRDLSQARPVWKSELWVPTAYGSAPDTRYATRSGFTGPGGGSSSPVVADNRVYIFFTQPSGPATMHARLAGGTAESTAAYAAKAFPERKAMQGLLVDFFRVHADEVLACLDARTGQLLWSTTLPARGNNYQTHKHRGHFPVPLIDGVHVYVAGTTGRVYALETKDGRLVWEYPGKATRPHASGDNDKWIRCGSPSPVRLGETLVVHTGDGLVGLATKSGERRWQTKGAYRGPLLPWHSGEKVRVLSLRLDHANKKTFLAALEVSTGKEAFATEVPLDANHVSPLLTPSLADSGTTLVGWSVSKAAAGKPGEHDGDVTVHAWKVEDTGLKPLWSTPGPKPMVDTPALLVQERHVVVSGFRETIQLDVATGKVTGRVAKVGGARTQIAQASGSHVLLQPEGRHGRQSFFLLHSDADTFEQKLASGSAKGTHPDAPGQWVPPHPLISPLVAGRIFVRGRDAIYCYDLREKE